MARGRLEKVAEQLAARQGKLDEQAEKLRERREEAIRAAYRDGLPMKAIAEVLGISHQRVSQIVRS